jgi:hypothetical protein
LGKEVYRDVAFLNCVRQRGVWVVGRVLSYLIETPLKLSFLDAIDNEHNFKDTFMRLNVAETEKQSCHVT